MDFITTAEAIAKLGMGTVAFAAVIFGAYRLMNWLEVVKSNHLPHIQAAIEKVGEHSLETNRVLREQSKMLTKIIDQTRK